VRGVTAAVAVALVLGAGACVDTPNEAGVSDVTSTTVDAAEQLARAERAVTVRVRATACHAVGVGTGFLADARVLVTAAHVVDRADEVVLQTWDGEDIPVGFVTRAVFTAADGDDLAVIHLDRDTGATALLAERDPALGDPVDVVGYPGGGRLRTTSGEVVDYVSEPDFDIDRAMRTTAQVRPGNSGGPVFDNKGRVVGVVFAYETDTGYGLAVPVSRLRPLLADRSAQAPVEPC
jgi:S1-C subfamily serine protease